MSYHVPEPRRVSRRALPQRVPVYPLQPPPQLLPLAQAPASSGMSRRNKILLVVLVLVVVVALLWWLDQRENKPVRRNRSTARKQSTPQMAKNLYERLQDRGGVDETTMRSLAQLSRNA